VVSGAVFELLNVAQLRYRAETEFLESFQGARLGVDLIVRDIHNAGYPPPYTFPGNFGKPPTPVAYPAGTWTDPLLAPAGVQNRFAIGILGLLPGGVMSTTCTVNGGASPCRVPNAWDLIMEEDIDPENNVAAPQIEWVRYCVSGAGNNCPATAAGAITRTMHRTIRTKVAAGDPTLLPSVVPFVENIVQDTTAAVSATNPALFTYECDPLMVITPGTNICTAENIKNVYVTLLVQSTRRDLTTQQFRQITVRGLASRNYPSRP
ncbi:MAG: hypothetical protein ACREN5_01565, partial [Gemmatimonadales bacterium]